MLPTLAYLPRIIKIATIMIKKGTVIPSMAEYIILYIRIGGNTIKPAITNVNIAYDTEKDKNT
jgi:hypothetical protein